MSDLSNQEVALMSNITLDEFFRRCSITDFTTNWEKTLFKKVQEAMLEIEESEATILDLKNTNYKYDADILDLINQLNASKETSGKLENKLAEKCSEVSKLKDEIKELMLEISKKESKLKDVKIYDDISRDLQQHSRDLHLLHTHGASTLDNALFNKLTVALLHCEQNIDLIRKEHEQIMRERKKAYFDALAKRIHGYPTINVDLAEVEPEDLKGVPTVDKTSG